MFPKHYGRTCFGSTHTKIGTIQRRLAWPLRKDDTQNREAFHIFAAAPSDLASLYIELGLIAQNTSSQQSAAGVMVTCKIPILAPRVRFPGGARFQCEIIDHSTYHRGCSSVVERSLCM